MPRNHANLPRLYVGQPLAVGDRIVLDRPRTSYLINVLRLRQGAETILFNGRDGAFRAVLADPSRKGAVLETAEQTEPQPPAADLWYFFAPLKTGRLDYMVQKATEMGVGHLQPVITQHTQVPKPNVERMRANIVEAAEQCEVLNLPQVHAPLALDLLLDAWPGDHPARTLILADESAPSASPLSGLGRIEGPVGLLIGPEGGFSDDELARLRGSDFVLPVSLGPRILRADTAAVAALAVIQSIIGDWR